MRKIMLMLLAIAATINAMAADPSYTAKAMVTLGSESGYSCSLMLSEAAEYGALNGIVMNMEDRKVALYGLNGTTKLQVVRASDLSDVKVGLITDASTSYTLSVSSVDGTPLKLYDKETGAIYELTDGATYNFTATANSTINDRFVLNIDVDTEPLETCFTGTELNIIHNPYFGKIVVKDGGGSTIKSYDYGTSSINFNEKNAKGYYYYTNGADYTVSFGGARAFIVTVKR